MNESAQSVSVGIVVFVLMLSLTGCAKHADFIELRDRLSTISRSQDQDHQRVDAVLRRLESVERATDTDTDPTKTQFDELATQLQSIEQRLAVLEDAMGESSAKLDSLSSRPHPPKPTKPDQAADQGDVIAGITPTSAFNLAYNDYLNGRYELAAAGFQRFIKDFPGTSLTPNAQYWLGESYYNLKDYGRAIQTFDFFVTEYRGNEKVPTALYRLGLATAETGDLAKSRKNLKRVLEEFPSSDESKLAKNKLAEIR